MLPEFLRRGLPRPLHLALSYDEEVRSIGVRRLIADIGARGVRPLGCIVGEPTGMRIVVAHKGKKTWRCRVRGHEAHSALTPLGVNAVEIACGIVSRLTALAQARRDGGPFDHGYDVAYTTVHTGTIRGGTALNIVPRDCAFEFEIRHLPFDDPDALFREIEAHARSLLPAMHAVDPDCYIEFDELSTMPGFEAEDASAIAALGHACNGDPDAGKVSFGSEASRFHAAAIPTILCGPGRIAQAHQPDEWVSVAELAACEAFMHRLADRICHR
jgi:acetylornithine deacetylase